MIDGMGMGTRLQRGKSYARKGQVISLDVDPGAVTALVQGSRARPCRVRIGIAAFGKPEWVQIERSLADDAWYAARLLAGEMPDDIEEVFAAAGLSLFPETAADLSLDCSCPDFAVPCKHLAAVFYLLAEAFDEDPFAILAWRGREREDLLANLAAARSDGPPAVDRAEFTDVPLADCLDTFFVRRTDLRMPTLPQTSVGALLDPVPDVDVVVRGEPLTDLLRAAYVGGADESSQRGC